MTDRSYLSIGDVLALLRDEFPDITISKIRFLESRGLLDPERTPSGYRKFCSPDVERLRWILRQQRENFLPLKVIKGRLEGVGAGEPAGDDQLGQGDGAPPGAGDGPEPLVAVMHELVGAAANGPAERPPVSTVAERSSRRSASSAGDAGRPGVAGKAGDRDAGDADAGDADARDPDAGDADAVYADVGDGDVGDADVGDADTGYADTGDGDVGEADAGDAKAGAGGVEPVGEMEHGGATADAAPSVHDADGSAGHAEEDPPAEPETAVEVLSAAQALGLSGVSLTVAELAEAAGMTSAEIEALVDYGLIEGRTVAGVTCFDEESLIISRLAAGFARYGLEPRHLRIFKHTAEREAGLFAQVVTGMFRQRNPEARRRAYEAIDELTELGRGIHASLLRVALRDLTGG